MKRYKALFAFCIAILIASFFSSCKHDSPSTPDVVMPAIPYTAETVITSIKGRVLDENKKPIQNALVIVGAGNAYTDISGEFVIRNTTVDRYKTVVTVFGPTGPYTLTSYAAAVRTLIVNPGTLNYVEIELIPQTNVGIINVATGGDINLSSGGTISFPADAIARDIVGPPLQNANVGLYVFDQKASNYRNIYWGDRRCLTKSGEERGLNPYAMAFLNLSDVNNNNQSLKIKPNKRVKISIPISGEFVSTAPATISSWYLSEGDGIWKEGLPATRVGNNYVLDIIYARAIACGVPYPLVKLTAIFKDESGNPLSKTNAEIGKTDGTLLSYGITDSLGKLTLLVPANQSLKLKLTNRCGADVYTKNIGPYSDAIDLGETTVKSPSLFPIIVKGQAVDCYNKPLSGNLILTIDGQDYSTGVKNGSFTIAAYKCKSVTDTIKVTFVDQNNVNNIYKTTILNVGTGIYDMGNVTACSIGLGDYISYSYGTTSELINPPSGDPIAFYRNSVYPYDTWIIYGSKASVNNYIQFSIPYDSPAGNVAISNLWVVNASNSIVSNFNATGTISYIKPAGSTELIVGDFTTNYVDPVKGNIPISCSFRLHRR